MSEIPDYIERRIRQPIPSGLCVVPGSTPVVAFGNARTAKVATIGLNPSSNEFQDRSGQDLVGCFRRLATHRSLGVYDLATASPAIIAKVLNDCNTYFQRNPYRWWFGQLESILQACGASYCDGSACHLDLVQWATKPTWNSLDTKAKRRLLDADARFVKEQLSNENIELLLVNGSGVACPLQEMFETEFKELCLDELGPIPGFGKNRTRLFTGSVLSEVRVVAWNVNLQSPYGVTPDLKAALAELVAQLTQES